MQDLDKFRIIYKLKSIYRLNSVADRHESTAEHTWSSLILADWILSESKLNIDEKKVYELLIYHDLVEIYAGDTPINLEQKKIIQKEKEHKAFERLTTELPSSMAKKYSALFNEFEDGKTIESRFAKAVDNLDAELHELDYKKDWKGWNEKFLRDKKINFFHEFPFMIKIFEESLKYCNENGFFNQE